MTEVIRGRYQLIDKLGQGGFGSVWRAHDNTLNREVAVKVLNLANENQEEMVARFKTESQVASSFEHQNILRVYDFGQDENGRCFLVSELLKGLSLHDKLKPKAPLPIELALDILYQVGSALEVAHAQKTVHRDIKPPNIFLNQPMKGPGFVKLLDFGIAKVIGGKQESLTVTGQIMGTPHYMSPEQIVNIKLVDHRSDIYSLGIVFYQMLTGVVPFDDESYFSIMRHQMQSPMPKLELPQYSLNLVNELQEILKLMTHKDVRKRVSEIKDILSRIEHIWHVHSVSSNALTTGSFRAISLTGSELSQSNVTVRNVDEGLEQMLDLAEDQNADALIESMFEVNEASTQEPQVDSSDPSETINETGGPIGEVLNVDSSLNDEVAMPVAHSPVAQSQAKQSLADQSQAKQSLADQSPSTEKEQTQLQEESLPKEPSLSEDKKYTQAIRKLPEQSKPVWPWILVALLTGVLIQNFLRALPQNGEFKKDISSIELDQSRGINLRASIRNTELDQAVALDQAVTLNKAVELDQAVEPDQAVLLDQAVLPDQAINSDQVKNLDQSVETAKAKVAEPSPQPKVSRSQKNKRSKWNQKEKSSRN